MARGKKNNNSRTPRRTSSRKRMRSMKGQYYDEHFNEFQAETEIITGSASTLEDSTPSIGNNLDTTVDIVNRITNDSGLSDELDVSEQPLGNSLSSEDVDLEEPNQFLSNLYELHLMQMQNCHFQYSLVESACFNRSDSVAIFCENNTPTKSKDEDDDIKKDECSKITWQLNQKTLECDSLSKQLIELVHEKKILSDRVNHLENEEGYRSEVVRLERLVEEKEITLQNLKDVAEVKRREVEIT